MNIGEYNKMIVGRITKSGAYLVPENDPSHMGVLLPGKYLDETTKVSDEIEVFLYSDSEDRIVATTIVPKIKVGEIAKLEVVDSTTVGTFLDWGLDKDLLLPFSEQTSELKKGDVCVVYAKLDRKDRVMATEHISNYLSLKPSFNIEDKVNCLIYKIVDDIGAFAVVEKKYSGLIPKKEIYQKLKVGQELECRVTYIKEEGHIDLAIRKKAQKQRVDDAFVILEKLKENNNKLYLHDKSSPKEINMVLHMSKAAFKRAIGKLYKERKIDIKDDSIVLL